MRCTSFHRDAGRQRFAFQLGLYDRRGGVYSICGRRDASRRPGRPQKAKEGCWVASLTLPSRRL